MQRKTKSVIACGMAAALMLTTLGMENEVSAKAAPKMQTKVLSLKKGQKKTIRIKGKGILKTTWKTTKKIITLTKKKKNKVTVAGKKIGTAVVVAKVKTKKKNYHLKCKVKVARAQGAKKTNVTNTKVPQTTKNPRKTESTPTVTPAATQDNTSKTEPSDTAQPSQTPASDVPEGYEEIDLSTCRMNNASEAGSYDSETKTLHIQDAENFQFPLKENINKGEVLSVMLKGTYHGTKGFRSWLVDDSQTTNSNIFNTNDEVGFTGGEIELLYDLEATTAAGQLFFKGPSYGVNIDDLEISKIYVKYTVSAGEKKSYDPYTPSEEQDANTDNLQLTKSFSEQKGMIGNNPLITQNFMADPTAVEYDGRLYVFGTADKMETDSKGNVISNSYNTCELRCISSADLVNWTDHGTIAVSGSKGAAKWSANSWAPAVCHKKINGKEKFFLYFANNASSIGVLTADSPTGPWTDPIGKPIIDRSITGCAESEIGWLFDPAVLVDDDGTGYLYFGGIGNTDGKKEDFIRNPKCARVVKLSDDMTSVDGDAKTIDAPFMFEDSGINKIGDKYYYSYCTNWTGSIDGVTIDRADCPTANIAVMVSDSPMGDFKYVGCVLKNPGTYFGVTGNNHHCFTQFNGKLYAFYHTKKDTIAVGTKQDYRTTYVNELNLGDNGDFTNADGTIADTKMTKTGVSSIGTINPYETVEAETFAMADTVGTVINNEKASNEDWAVNYSVYNGKIGAYIGVADVDFGTDGASEITMKLGDSTSDSYQTVTKKLGKKLTGKHTIYFEFDTLDVRMDSWSFKK